MKQKRPQMRGFQPTGMSLCIYMPTALEKSGYIYDIEVPSYLKGLKNVKGKVELLSQRRTSLP